MASDYKSKVYQNVKALAFLQDRQMADIEKAIGHAVGFLSRKSSTLDIDTVVQLCKVLDVSMDDLLNRDYTHELEKRTALQNLYRAVDAALPYYEDAAVVEMVAAHLGEVLPDDDDRK